MSLKELSLDYIEVPLSVRIISEGFRPILAIKFWNYISFMHSSDVMDKSD